jgi:hypothetical protein
MEWKEAAAAASFIFGLCINRGELLMGQRLVFPIFHLQFLEYDISQPTRR